MSVFALGLFLGDRLPVRREEGPVLFGTTRVAAMIQRFEDEVVCAEGEAFTTGPVEQRREAA